MSTDIQNGPNNSYGVVKTQVEFFDCHSKLGIAFTCDDGTKKAFRFPLPDEVLNWLDQRWKERHPGVCC